MKHTSIFVIIVLVVVTGGLGFYGGMQYQSIQRSQARNMAGRQFPGAPIGQTQNRTGGLSGRPIVGEVISKDDKSITVKTEGFGSRIVMFSNTTTVTKTSDATIQDIAVGEKVGVFGIENSDKTTTAQNIQLNPQFRMGGAQLKPTK